MKPYLMDKMKMAPHKKPLGTQKMVYTKIKEPKKNGFTSFSSLLKYYLSIKLSNLQSRNYFTKCFAKWLQFHQKSYFTIAAEAQTILGRVHCSRSRNHFRKSTPTKLALNPRRGYSGVFVPSKSRSPRTQISLLGCFEPSFVHHYL